MMSHTAGPLPFEPEPVAGAFGVLVPAAPPPPCVGVLVGEMV